MDKNPENELINFISEVISRILLHHKIDLTEAYNIIHQCIFTDYEHYGDEIHKIDPNAGYTDDGQNLGMGKVIRKDGKNYMVINSNILLSLKVSEFKNVISKYLIYHEIGHCVNYTLHPENYIGKNSKRILPLKECSKLLFDIAIDEYNANNIIIFLLSDEDCRIIINDKKERFDVNNLFNNISDPYDLFNRIWNGPTALFFNLLKDYPLIMKAGGFKNTEKLDKIGIIDILLLFDKREITNDQMYEKLIDLFNYIVDSYNNENSFVKQKTIK